MWIDSKGSTVLPVPECKQLLGVAATNSGVGRIGIPTDHAPVILPVNFTFHDGQVRLRVGPGFLSQAAAGNLVAFEVDHVDLGSKVAWSVLVRGLATLIESPTEPELETTPQPLIPEPGEMVLLIRPDVVTGRRFEVHSTPQDRQHPLTAT